MFLLADTGTISITSNVAKKFPNIRESANIGTLCCDWGGLGRVAFGVSCASEFVLFFGDSGVIPPRRGTGIRAPQGIYMPDCSDGISLAVSFALLGGATGSGLFLLKGSDPLNFSQEEVDIHEWLASGSLPPDLADWVD
jgi:hypothetical protein